MVIPAPITLSDSQRDALTHWSTGTDGPPERALHSRVLLSLADGRTDGEVAADLDVPRAVVSACRAEFLRSGIDGLGQLYDVSLSAATDLGAHGPGIAAHGTRSASENAEDKSAPEQAPPKSRPVNQDREENRSLGRREVMLALGGAALGVAGGALVNLTINPKVEPLAQKEVDNARRAEAQARGTLDMKVVQRDFGGAAFGWVFADPLTPEQERHVLDSDAYLAEWAEQNGGVLYTVSNGRPGMSHSRVRMAVTNHWPSEIRVTDIRARVERTDPLSGALVFVGAQGGEPIIDVGFDLEEENPQARARLEDGRLGDRYTDDQTVKFAPGEIVVFDLTAQVTRSCCRWQVEVDALVDGELRTFTGDDGPPFVTTAAASRYDQRFFFDVGDNNWHAAGAGGMP